MLIWGNNRNSLFGNVTGVFKGKGEGETELSCLAACIPRGVRGQTRSEAKLGAGLLESDSEVDIVSVENIREKRDTGKLAVFIVSLFDSLR